LKIHALSVLQENQILEIQIKEIQIKSRRQLLFFCIRRKDVIISVIIRLEKVTTYEVQLADGKTLNNEQLAVLNSKKSLEKSVFDLSSMKSQLEEVAKVSQFK